MVCKEFHDQPDSKQSFATLATPGPVWKGFYFFFLQSSGDALHVADNSLIKSLLKVHPLETFLYVQKLELLSLS